MARPPAPVVDLWTWTRSATHPSVQREEPVYRQRHACAYWREHGKAGDSVSGRIVNTTSGARVWGNVGRANHASAKAATAALTLVMAMEMERYGVNCLSPIAAMLATIGKESTAEGWDRLDPANASPLVAWLCSEEAGWVTG